MVDPDRSLLEDLVEIDEATLPFRIVKDPTTGGQGRSRQGKMRIAGAVELSPEGEPRRIRLAPIGDFSARSLHAFVAGTSAPGARVITDELVGWRRVMTDTPQVLLAHHLKTLKLPTFLREYDKLARQCATEGADHVRYLVRLTELELIDRERRMVERRIRQARFPAVKSLDSFDFKAIASLNKMLVLELARCEYVERRENIIALGNSGTGKTHIACAFR